MSRIVPFETIMHMNYDDFHTTFALWESESESVSVSVLKREKPDCLTLCDGVYADFLDWAYFNRHLLEFLSIKDMYDLAPSFYPYKKKWYMVNKKDMSYRPISQTTSPIALRRSFHVTPEEIKESFLIGEEWSGPFMVSPHVYLNEDHLRDYLTDICVS